MLRNSLTPALDIFLLDCQARNLAAETLEFYRERVHHFARFAGKENVFALHEVTPTLLRTYFVALQTQGWKSNSVHAAARALKAFFNFCVYEELLERSPMQRIRLPKTDKHIKPAFEMDEVEQLIAAAKTQRDRAIILCLLDTGCRAKEFLAWNVEDVNAATGTVQLRHTKNRKARVVYLGLRSRKELLKLYLQQGNEPGTPVWRNLSNGERLQYYGLAITLRKLGRRTGILPCNPHRFRRTHAIASLRNGMDVYTLAALMGHSDISVLRKYLPIVEADLMRAAGSYGVVDNSLTAARGA